MIWAKPKLDEYKRIADTKWQMSETTHYLSNIYQGVLKIEVGPRDRDDVPGSWHWFSVGMVVSVPGKQEFKFKVKYPNKVCVQVNSWDELISTLESDLEEYNRKMLRALQKNIELAIDNLPG